MRITVLEHRFRISISFLKMPLVAACLTVPHPLRGAGITWGPATDIAGDSDVIDNGAPVYAYDWGHTPPNVNGVSFTASSGINGGTNVLAAFAYSGSSYFDSTSNNFAALSSAYRDMLVGADYTAAAGPFSVPVTLAGLTIGRKYLVQVWVNDPRGPYNTRSETITSTGGNTNTLHFSTQTLSNPGGPGQYTVGTFTADSTNQTFTLMGDPLNNVTQMNALQVRDIGAQTLPTLIGINPAGAGAVQLIFNGPPGAHYTLLTTTDIAAPAANWTPLPNGTGTFDSVTLTNIDSAATNKARFYQIRSP
jgi:hypothetical protein